MPYIALNTLHPAANRELAAALIRESRARPLEGLGVDAYQDGELRVRVRWTSPDADVYVGFDPPRGRPPVVFDARVAMPEETWRHWLDALRSAGCLAITLWDGQAPRYDQLCLVHRRPDLR